MRAAHSKDTGSDQGKASTHTFIYNYVNWQEKQEVKREFLSLSQYVSCSSEVIRLDWNNAKL